MSLLFRAGFAASTSMIVVLAVACGGGDDKPAKSPADDTSAAGSSSGASSGAGSSGGDSTGSSSGSGAAASSGATPVGNGTTTTQLGDGGDLQGAKLGDKMHTTTETTGPSGPKGTGGQSAGEPGRNVADIKAIVAARRDDARACYDKGVAAHPGIEGNLDIKWTIDPQGNVTDASLDQTKSQILEPSVANCVIEIVKKIKFAASAKGYETHAHYPFDFHPKTFTAKDAGK
jgi:outer membrane biosynthesis protein TonB